MQTNVHCMAWCVLWVAAVAAGCKSELQQPRQPQAGTPAVGAPIGGAGGFSGMAAPVAGTGGAAGVSGAGVPTAGMAGSAGMNAPTAGTGVVPMAGTDGGSVFDAGVEPDRNAVTPGVICDRLATIQCAGEAACCDAPGRDFDTCKRAQLSDCDTMTMADDVAADPVTAFDAAQAMVVFAELERLASICDPAFAAFGESFDGLRSMFRGTVAASGDCRPNSVLDKAMAGAALASCTDHRSQACMPSLTSWRCQPHSAAGGECFSDVNCAAGLFCDNPNFSLSGAECMPRKAIGQSCSLANECESLFCEGGMCVVADAQVAYCLSR